MGAAMLISLSWAILSGLLWGFTGLNAVPAIDVAWLAIRAWLAISILGGFTALIYIYMTGHN